jgi:hypothetical protein
MKILLLKHTLLTVVLTSFSFTVSAEWVLKNAESSLNFISIKKITTGEVHSFNRLQGSIKKSGDIKVSVKLSSVDTNIPIRNDRMQQFLFEVTKFPQATASTKIDFKHIEKMKVGDSYTQKVPLKLSLHGHDLNVKSEMRISLLNGNKLLVSTIKPVIVNAGDFALIKGIEKLQELAKLPSISTAVPVSASFIFENNDSK